MSTSTTTGIDELLASAWEAWTGLPPRRVEIVRVAAAPGPQRVRTRVEARFTVHWRPRPVVRTITVDRFASIDDADTAAQHLCGSIGDHPSARPHWVRADEHTVAWMETVGPDPIHRLLERIDPIAALAAS